MKKNLLAIGAFVLILTSCSTSQTALQDLRGLSYRINTEGATYDIDDWKATAKKYVKVDKKIVKYAVKGKYTQAESQEIGRLQSDCVRGFTKGVGQNVSNRANGVINIIKGIIDGFKGEK